MAELTQAVAGDSWVWSRADLTTLYPPGDGWVLSYRFAPEAGGASVEVTADAAFAVRVAPATSAGFAPGWWRWRAIVADGTDRVTVATGRLEVAPDPAAATAPDLRSHAERALAMVEATLEGRITKDVEAYTIEGRSITRIPAAELYKLRAKYAEIVRRERGEGAARLTRVDFT